MTRRQSSARRRATLAGDDRPAPIALRVRYPSRLRLVVGHHYDGDAARARAATRRSIAAVASACRDAVGSSRSNTRASAPAPGRSLRVRALRRRARSPARSRNCGSRPTAASPAVSCACGSPSAVRRRDSRGRRRAASPAVCATNATRRRSSHGRALACRRLRRHLPARGDVESDEAAQQARLTRRPSHRAGL